MSQVNRTALKGYFETGDVPTQAQFINLMDSVPNFVDDGVIVSGDNAITAHAGGGQADATLLEDLINRLSVVANANDSVKLKAAVAGNIQKVYNAGANAADCYPATGEQIMALGVNNPQSIGVGEYWSFESTGTGWIAVQLI